jgi:DNA-directed RNA polymerase subunit beta
MGFIETPYRTVENGKVNLNDLKYLSAEEEEEKKIAQSNTPMDAEGNFLEEKIVSEILAIFQS